MSVKSKGLSNVKKDLKAGEEEELGRSEGEREPNLYEMRWSYWSRSGES